jgi:hypothetical protein
MCFVCPLVGFLGGWVGSSIGIDPPKHTAGKIFSLLITGSLVSITFIALKRIFDIPICGGGGFTLGNIIRVGMKGIICGIIYSIGVNYILGRYVFLPHSKEKQDGDILQDDSQQDKTPACCCKHK